METLKALDGAIDGARAALADVPGGRENALRLAGMAREVVERAREVMEEARDSSGGDGRIIGEVERRISRVDGLIDDVEGMVRGYYEGVVEIARQLEEDLGDAMEGYLGLYELGDVIEWAREKLERE